MTSRLIGRGWLWIPAEPVTLDDISDAEAKASEVETRQAGPDRAGYGQGLVSRLSEGGASLAPVTWDGRAHPPCDEFGFVPVARGPAVTALWRALDRVAATPLGRVPGWMES